MIWLQIDRDKDYLILKSSRMNENSQKKFDWTILNEDLISYRNSLVQDPTHSTNSGNQDISFNNFEFSFLKRKPDELDQRFKLQISIDNLP